MAKDGNWYDTRGFCLPILIPIPDEANLYSYLYPYPAAGKILDPYPHLLG
jgi:hypothetical protein